MTSRSADAVVHLAPSEHGAHPTVRRAAMACSHSADGPLCRRTGILPLRCLRGLDGLRMFLRDALVVQAQVSLLGRTDGRVTGARGSTGDMPRPKPRVETQVVASEADRLEVGALAFPRPDISEPAAAVPAQAGSVLAGICSRWARSVVVSQLSSSAVAAYAGSPAWLGLVSRSRCPSQARTAAGRYRRCRPRWLYRGPTPRRRWSCVCGSEPRDLRSSAGFRRQEKKTRNSRSPAMGERWKACVAHLCVAISSSSCGRVYRQTATGCLGQQYAG